MDGRSGGREVTVSRPARRVRVLVTSTVLAGTLALFAAGPAMADGTSALFVYERPETRTMPSPLPRVPQAPVTPATPSSPGTIVDRDTVPPPPSGEVPPPTPAEQPPRVPEAENSPPSVGERLPVTGMDAALLLGAASLAAAIGLALRRAGSAERFAPVGFEIPFAVPVLEPVQAAEGPIAPAGPAELSPAPAAGRSAKPLLVLGAVAAGGLGLAAMRGRRGRRPSTLREAFAAAARPAARPEPAGALLVAMAVPAIARRIGGQPRRRPRTRPRPAAVRPTEAAPASP
jgi:hypothetical protein